LFAKWQRDHDAYLVASEDSQGYGISELFRAAHTTGHTGNPEDFRFELRDERAFARLRIEANNAVGWRDQSDSSACRCRALRIIGEVMDAQ
jgi:hypothetical protein